MVTGKDWKKALKAKAATRIEKGMDKGEAYREAYRELKFQVTALCTYASTLNPV